MQRFLFSARGKDRGGAPGCGLRRLKSSEQQGKTRILEVLRLRAIMPCVTR